MFKPKISHEVPLCLLELSKQFNDYDYCLPHLLDQDEEYKNYFPNSFIKISNLPSYSCVKG